MKKILIIGGTGTISAPITRRLCEDPKNQVYLLNRGNKKTPEHAESIIADIHDTNREQYENYIKDKIRRYFYLVQNENFLEKNVHNLKTIPKLVIVAEDPSHLDELEKMLTPIVELLRVDERAEVIFITDYGVCTGKIYNPQFFDE